VKGMKKSVLAIFLVIFLVSCGAARHKFTPPKDGKMYVYIEDDYSAYKNGIIIRLLEEAKSDLFCDEEAIKKFKEAHNAYSIREKRYEEIIIYCKEFREGLERPCFRDKVPVLVRPYRDDALILLFEAIIVNLPTI
jgi:hypothetical protein